MIRVSMPTLRVCSASSTVHMQELHSFGRSVLLATQQQLVMLRIPTKLAVCCCMYDQLCFKLDSRSMIALTAVLDEQVSD
jgi:hypothetical protein